MFLILLTWLYIFIVTLIIGVSIRQLLELNHLNTIITLFIGLFGISIFTGFWAILLPINGTFQVILLLISCLLFYKNKKMVVDELTALKTLFNTFSLFFKSILVVLLLLILAQCASAPFVIDNESYYIQTIKWLNTYGFVKGLANLHLFLGQTSGWHILQSAFSFSFAYHALNDISGFCLLLGNFYAITALDSYIKNSKKQSLNLIIGLFPVLNVFFFQFISAPSADIAIYVIALIIFHQFIICFSAYNKTRFISVALLTVFAAFIKLTGVFFFILTIILYVKHFSEAKKTTKSLTFIGSLTLVLFSIKNIIITGNIMYPLHGIKGLNTSWSLPEIITNYVTNYSKASAYGLSLEDYNNATALKRFKSWLFLPKLHGILNKLMLLLLAIFPFVALQFKYKREMLCIYAVSLITLFVLFMNVPQYRFFFPFLMLFLLSCFSFILKQKKVIYTVFTLAIIITAIPLFYTINNTNLTNTKYHTASSTFSFNHVIFPHKNTKYNTNYESITVGDFKINAPTEIDFFWGTGDIPLPALNEQQLDYFSTYFNIIPQQRGKTLNEGFYSKDLLND